MDTDSLGPVPVPLSIANWPRKRLKSGPRRGGNTWSRSRISPAPGHSSPTVRISGEAPRARLSLLAAHHARPGWRFGWIRCGLFRLRLFPSSPHERTMAVWLPFRDAVAVVSHESALELLELSDVVPDAVQLTLLRSERGQRRRDGIQRHFPSNDPAREEIRQVEGLPVTSPVRTIVFATFRPCRDLLQALAQVREPKRVGVQIFPPQTPITITATIPKQKFDANANCGCSWPGQSSRSGPSAGVDLEAGRRRCGEAPFFVVSGRHEKVELRG